MTEGKVINCRAAVLWEVGGPFVIEEIQVQPPGKGEIRVKIIASGIVNFVHFTSFGSFILYISP